MRSYLMVLMASMCLYAQVAADDATMSFNEMVQVVPAPGPVVVDGDDSDWDLSAGVWSYNDPTIVDRYSVWTHLMWDAKGIYFLARVHDASPLMNAASGRDFSESWRADCFQARVIFDDRQKDEHQMHVNMYHSTIDKQPYMIVHHGGFKSKPPYDQTGPKRLDQLAHWGPTMDKHGGGIASKAWENGQGYNIECFWPWSYCRTSGKALAVGEQFTFGIETMWGSNDGTKLQHRLADLIKSESVNRIFMFRAREGWGKAVIVEKGGVLIAQQQKALQAARLKRFVDYDTYGSIPIHYTLPENRDVTIAIEDSSGLRVRNLFGQYPKGKGVVKDLWDGLDDGGNPVKPGSYQVRILHHEPIGLKFFNSSYSSSTPPWTTEKGSLYWGSNHGHPTSVATRGDKTVMYFTGTEGGMGILRINDKGIIQWSDGQEFIDGCIDDTFAYGLSKSSWMQKTLLVRYHLETGQLTPFDDEERTPSPALIDHSKIPVNSTLAYAHGKIWSCFPGKFMQRIDPKTAHIEEQINLDGLLAISDRDGQLFGLYEDHSLHVIGADGKAAKKICSIVGLKNPVRIAVDMQSQQFLISDHGTNQVLLIDSTGAIQQKFGSAYGASDRPAGAFVKTDLIKPMGTGFDHLSRIWIPEGVKSCKRMTMWNAQGELLDQFWGQADYGAMEGWPIVRDSTRFIAHGIEFKLDPDPQPLLRKTEEQAEIYHPHLAHKRGMVFTYEGQDFAVSIPGFNRGTDVYIFRRDAQGVFTPCVHITKNSRGKGKGQAWIDHNADGKRSDDELTQNVDWLTLYWSNGHARPDMTLMTVKGHVFHCSGLNGKGIPQYDFSKPEIIKNFPKTRILRSSGSTPVIDNAGNVSDGLAWLMKDGRRGTYPNRYGRHDAPAARRGQIIAAFRANGVVEDIPGLGSITAIGGDRGEWFLMSLDGMYISNICQDIKGNLTLDDTLIGGESFGGYIWRDELTQKVLVQLGGASYRIMEVTGLETCVLEKQTINVTDEQIKEGVLIAQKRQQSGHAEPSRLRIARVRNVPSSAPPVMQPLSQPLMDGATDVRVVAEGNPGQWWRAAMAIKHKDLVVAWQVSDASPWRNGEQRFTHAFIGGDCVDMKLNVPRMGPIRLLVAPIKGKPMAAYSQVKEQDGAESVTYAVANNLANATKLGQVRRVDAVNVKAATGFNTYTLLVTIPLAELGLEGVRGKEISGVLGVIYSDPSGTNRAARLYWHDKSTGMVNDVPTEARLDSKKWGPIDIDK